MSLNTILICGSWLIAIIAYICYGSIKERYESLKNQNMELKGDVKELKEVISVLENEGKLKAEKEREINEKIARRVCCRCGSDTVPREPSDNT